MVPPAGAAAPNVRFAPRTDFLRAVRADVDAYFRAKGVAPQGDWRLYLKGALVLAWLVGSYLALLLAARAWWQALPLALSTGFAAAWVGFNVHHDANHGAFAHSSRANRRVGFILDLLGGSSYVWRRRHNVFHHAFTNIEGHDADINGMPLVRMSTRQRRLPIHAHQHLYCWFAYALFPYRWWFWDDFHDLATGAVHGRWFPRPRGREIAGVVLGKLAFFAWALVLPLALHPWANVLACLALAATVLGVSLALSAQLSHCVDETTFPTTTDEEWAAHQVRTCSGFSHGSWFATAFWGGLNFQVEHHLFPRVSHVHYPAIAPLVKAACARHGLPYLEHATFAEALRSHGRMMRRVGAAT